jgi:hypothetical protein
VCYNRGKCGDNDSCISLIRGITNHSGNKVEQLANQAIMSGSDTSERGEGTKAGSSIGEIEADNGDQKRGSQMHAKYCLTHKGIRT